MEDFLKPFDFSFQLFPYLGLPFITLITLACGTIPGGLKEDIRKDTFDRNGKSFPSYPNLKGYIVLLKDPSENAEPQIEN